MKPDECPSVSARCVTKQLFANTILLGDNMSMLCLQLVPLPSSDPSITAGKT